MDARINLQSETVDQCSPDEPLCLPPDARVRDALRQLKERNHAAVLVCREQKLIGIFTERDALKMMAGGANFDVPLDQVMTQNPVALRACDTVGRAIATMSGGGYRRLPIVNEHGQPTGIIKVEGILHFLVEHFPGMVYNLPPEPHHSTQVREGA